MPKILRCQFLKFNNVLLLYISNLNKMFFFWHSLKWSEACKLVQANNSSCSDSYLSNIICHTYNHHSHASSQFGGLFKLQDFWRFPLLCRFWRLSLALRKTSIPPPPQHPPASSGWRFIQSTEPRRGAEVHCSLRPPELQCAGRLLWNFCLMTAKQTNKQTKIPFLP